MLFRSNEAFSKLAKDKDIPAFAAFSSIFKAYEIAITPVKAPFLISGVLSSAKKAYSLDSKSPYTNIANANLMFYFPESLGGDKKKALEYYQNAYKYYINNPEQASTDWIYLNILSTIGVVYEKIGDRANAKRWWIEAERIEPEFKHVTNVLLPRVNDVNI